MALAKSNTDIGRPECVTGAAEIIKFKVRAGTSRDIEELTRQRHRMFEDMHARASKDLRIHDGVFPRWVRRQMKAKRFVSFLAETEDGGNLNGRTQERINRFVFKSDWVWKRQA